MSDTYEQLTIIQQFEFLRNDLNATAHIITYSPSSRDWDHVHDWLRRTAERVTTLEQQATARITTLERELAEAKAQLTAANATIAELTERADVRGKLAETFGDVLCTIAGETDRVRACALASDRFAAMQATIAACKEAGFIDAEGRVRTVARLVNIGKYPSDQCDRIIDVLHEGQTVFVCTPAAAKEAQ